MSWGVRVVTEYLPRYFVRCSTCGLNEEHETEEAAQVRLTQHIEDHDLLYDGGNTTDLGYELTNSDPDYEDNGDSQG